MGLLHGAAPLLKQKVPVAPLLRPERVGLEGALPHLIALASVVIVAGVMNGVMAQDGRPAFGVGRRASHSAIDAWRRIHGPRSPGK